jgi:hypothetical protein
MSRFVVRSLVVVVALAAGFLAGWFSHQPAPPESRIGSSQRGTISGYLYAEGGPTDKTYPLTGDVFVSGVSGNIRRFRVPVGPDSGYSVSVLPGTYTLTGRSPQFNDGRVPCSPASSVTVTDGRVVTVDVVCQMK